MCLGIPGKIIEITDAEKMMAKVDIAGVKRQVSIACIIDEEHSAESCLGEWVLIHVGFAMARIDEKDAYETLEYLTKLGEAQKELQEQQE